MSRTPIPAPALQAFGPGKVILLGEHGVVYGRPALAAPLRWGVTATGAPGPFCQLVIPKALRGPSRALLARAFARAAEATGGPGIRVTVRSELPVSMGLGSSAALSVACARLLLRASGKVDSFRAVSRIALLMEQEFHGTPSGVDHTTSAQARLIYFRKAKSGAAQVREVKSRRPLKVVVALVGPRESTRLLVTGLRERVERWPVRYRRLLDELGSLVDEGVKAIASGDLESLGDLMTINQGLLGALQLSSPAVEQMVDRLRKLGALGAKLTGAGGNGGAVIGLFLDPEQAVTDLTAEGIDCFASQLAGPPAL